METATKRLQRELPQPTKDKISKALIGRKKNDEHRMHISQGLKRYWQTIPSRENNETTIEDIML